MSSTPAQAALRTTSFIARRGRGVHGGQQAPLPRWVKPTEPEALFTAHIWRYALSETFVVSVLLPGNKIAGNSIV